MVQRSSASFSLFLYSVSRFFSSSSPPLCVVGSLIFQCSHETFNFPLFFCDDQDTTTRRPWPLLSAKPTSHYTRSSSILKVPVREQHAALCEGCLTCTEKSCIRPHQKATTGRCPINKVKASKIMVARVKWVLHLLHLTKSQ